MLLCLLFDFIHCVLLLLSIIKLIEHGLISFALDQGLRLVAVSLRLFWRHQNLFSFHRRRVDQIVFYLFQIGLGKVFQELIFHALWMIPGVRGIIQVDVL